MYEEASTPNCNCLFFPNGNGKGNYAKQKAEHDERKLITSHRHPSQLHHTSQPHKSYHSPFFSLYLISLHPIKPMIIKIKKKKSQPRCLKMGAWSLLPPLLSFSICFPFFSLLLSTLTFAQACFGL